MLQLEVGNRKVAFIRHTGHTELQLLIIFNSQQNTKLHCGRTALYIIYMFSYVIITHFHYRCILLYGSSFVHLLQLNTLSVKVCIYVSYF
jgi:uncharacterized membrane protein